MAGITIQDSESLGLYLRDISSSKPLSGEEEVRLAKKIKAGDQRAREKLVAANLRFVVRVAKQFQNRGIPLADLISAGNMGLMNAVEKFDGTRGIKFISYAVWWIRQGIQKSLAEDSRVVRLPNNRVGLLHSISRASGKLQQIQEDSPGSDAIADLLGIPVEMVQDTLSRSREAKSLDTPLQNDAEYSLMQMIVDEKQEAPDAMAVESSVRQQVDLVLETLDEREARVLRLHFGLGGKEPKTLESIGKILHLSRERIRQIKEKALKRLRLARRRAKLEPLRIS
jgi:RNA polymerase primary sigma factor